MTQETALKILKQGHNVFLTGPAGTGKTYLLSRYIEDCRRQGKNVAVTASTGIAATHMQGMTIHSWCGMGIKKKLAQRDISNLKKDFKLKCRMTKADVLIIDEVSMLHDYQLEMVNKIGRLFKNPFLPMGGLQVILCGDFFQLPPVGKGLEKPKTVIYSQAWQELDLTICYLHEVHRQKDDGLARVLQAIRDRCVGHDELKLLLSREGKEVVGCVYPTKLFAINEDADEINRMELKKLPGQQLEYQMTSRGQDALVKRLKKDCLAPEKLALKEGATVMFVKNNPDEHYANGTIGEVVGFCQDQVPIVRTRSGENIIVTPQTWVMEDEGLDEPLASITQYPLRLAWAITIHKSQGMTLDTVEIDLGKAFEYGQGYVALSRARSLEGIKLLGLNETALQVDPVMHEVDKLLRQLSTIVENEISSGPTSQNPELEYVSEDNIILDEDDTFSPDRQIDLDVWSPDDDIKARDFLKALKGEKTETTNMAQRLRLILSRLRSRG